MEVRHIMTSKVETLDVDDRLPDADVLMRLRRIRHLPVLHKDGTLAGLITHRDLLRAREPRVSVTQLMTRNVQTCTPETPVLDAARTMIDNKFGCLPVVADDVVVGIVTEADFVRWAVEELGSPR